ncbi:MAG: L,D-transpeptidase, partial [Actinobacteria bacterium]
IAIHATAETETIGQPDSHGCLRVTAADANWLIKHVPEGTPVTITG